MKITSAIDNIFRRHSIPEPNEEDAIDPEHSWTDASGDWYDEDPREIPPESVALLHHDELERNGFGFNGNHHRPAYQSMVPGHPGNQHIPKRPDYYHTLTPLGGFQDPWSHTVEKNLESWTKDYPTLDDALHSTRRMYLYGETPESLGYEEEI